MKKETEILLAVLFYAGGYHYWFSGYAWAGNILLILAVFWAYRTQRSEARLEALFWGMLLFCLFCLAAAYLIAELVLSGFLSMAFLGSLTGAALLMKTNSFKHPLQVWRRIEGIGFIALSMFLLGAFLLPPAALCWVGYPLLSRINRAGLFLIVAELFLPIMFTPLILRAGLVKRKLQIPGGKHLSSTKWPVYPQCVQKKDRPMN